MQKEKYQCPIQLMRKTEGRVECEGFFTIDEIKEHLDKYHKAFVTWSRKYYKQLGGSK